MHQKPQQKPQQKPKPSSSNGKGKKGFTIPKMNPLVAFILLSLLWWVHITDADRDIRKKSKNRVRRLKQTEQRDPVPSKAPGMSNEEYKRVLDDYYNNYFKEYIEEGRKNDY